MNRTVLALKDLKNFYWVLSNEPDFGGAAAGQPLITWLRYMANSLRDAEPVNPHLIAVNVTTDPPSIDGHPDNDDDNPALPRTRVITAMTQEPNVDIIASHYVQLIGKVGPTGSKILTAHRYGSIKLLKSFNTYTAAGQRTVKNKKLWGFSEDRPDGLRGWVPRFAATAVYKSFDPPWAAAATQVGSK